MNVFFLFSLIGLFLALFIFLLLIGKKDQKQNDLYLAFLILFLGFSLINEIIFPSGWYRSLSCLIKIDLPFRFLLGPFLYFYVRSLTERSFRFRHISLLHFIPFGLVFLYLMPFYFSGVEAKQAYGDTYVESGYFLLPREWITWVGFQLSLWYYSINCMIRLTPVFRRIKKKDYSRYAVMRNWQHILMSDLSVLLLILLILDVHMVAGYALDGFHDVIALFLSASLLLLSYFGLAPRDYVTVNLDSPLPEDHYERDACRLYRIEIQIRSEKSYLEPTLSLEDLAKRVNLSRTELSALINGEGHQNYYDFINAFRVEEFKERLFLPENRNLNILDIALDAGFNSKSTFNKVFKAQTGMTPLQYKKSHTNRER